MSKERPVSIACATDAELSRMLKNKNFTNHWHNLIMNEFVRRKRNKG